MSHLSLHLRARRVPAAVLVAVSGAACAWLGWALFSGHPEVGPQLAVFALMIASVAVSVTLAGDDEALERTGSLPWPQVRALHLLVAFILLTGFFMATHGTGVHFGSWAFVTRDLAGLLGLTALGAAALGVQRAWFVPVFLTVIAVFLSGSGDDPLMQTLTWMVQPTGTTTSTITAITLAAVGAAAYVRGRPGLPRAESL